MCCCNAVDAVRLQKALGFGAAATAEISVADLDNPLELAGFGFTVGTFAAAGGGATAQVSGSGPLGGGRRGRNIS